MMGNSAPKIQLRQLWWLVLFISLAMLPTIDSFCFGILCGVAPLMSKYCCKLKRFCCIEYQQWLAPIIGTNDILSEYVEAVAHEVINDQEVYGIAGLPRRDDVDTTTQTPHHFWNFLFR